jgi:hypothetical protein
MEGEVSSSPDVRNTPGKYCIPWGVMKLPGSGSSWKKHRENRSLWAASRSQVPNSSAIAEPKTKLTVSFVGSPPLSKIMNRIFTRRGF